MLAKWVSWRGLLDLGWLLILCSMFWFFWRDRNATRKTKLWMKTSGHITHCEWTTHGHRVWPKIVYTYRVDERDLVGEALFLPYSHTNPNSAHARQLAYRVTTAYKNDEDITVYYNPNNPDQAVIDTAVPRKLNLILIFLSILIMLHLAMIYKSGLPFFY